MRSIDSTLYVTQWCVVATMVLAGACSRASGGGDQRNVPADAIKIDDVDVRVMDPGLLIVQYRTRTSIQDCKAQAAEMPGVWDLVVKARLTEAAVQRVVLFPEKAGRSLSFTFTKSGSGQWSALAPCSISIPAGPTSPSPPHRATETGQKVGAERPRP
jgi:hypothetical protein